MGARRAIGRPKPAKNLRRRAAARPAGTQPSLREALRRSRAAEAEARAEQAATAEILKVISRSPTDVEPVFEAIARNAVAICNSVAATVFRYDGDLLHFVASYNATGDQDLMLAKYPMRPDRSQISGRTVLSASVVRIEDARSDPDYDQSIAAAGNIRCLLGVPMLRDGKPIGAIVVRWPEPNVFTDARENLLRTFADQAVIAIENARLFREIEEKGRQLEEASRHKSQFLASMSHELRTPLNAILGFNEMMLDGLYGELPAELKEPLDETQKSGKHLLRLINNVLDLAKIEAGRMELALTDYSVQDTVESVRSTLRPLAAEKGLDFLATVPADIPLAYGDGGRIAQCLMNLAGNSLKFTKRGKVEIAVTQRGGLLRYSVSDTGIGIPPDKIGSLFTEFKQTDADIASEYGGTGLGLSITKKFIEMHGGGIWVESEVGKGSSFMFEIPLRVAR